VSVRYVSQLEAAFADYGAPKAYNDYAVLRPRRRLGVVGLRLRFLQLIAWAADIAAKLMVLISSGARPEGACRNC